MNAAADADAWRPTVRACRLGMFVQALVINLAPLLFVALREQFGLHWEQVGRLVLINFLTQIAVDLAGGWIVARFGLRGPCMAAQGFAAAGLLVFALAPSVGGYAMLVAGTVVFSAGCGLHEVLLSPILNAVPSQRKAGDMALLHAFYPIGKLTVILGTAAALWLGGARIWPWVAVAWAVVPLYGVWDFARVRLPELPGDGERQRVRDLRRSPSFLFVLAAMLLAGASEVALAQWTSAFAQRGLGCSQPVGDLLGFGCFAVGMIIGRLWYGLHGSGRGLGRLLLGGAAASALVYLTAALSPWPALALAACALGGLAVSMLWPWTVSLAAAAWPLAGASLFALLAAAGDTGAAFSPWLVSIVADLAALAPPALPGGGSAESLGLRAGLLVGAAAPLLLAAVAWRLRKLA